MKILRRMLLGLMAIGAIFASTRTFEQMANAAEDTTDVVKGVGPKESGATCFETRSLD